jgi:regulator of protease activity HflC (stomatin/prohibitin superfamily)
MKEKLRTASSGWSMLTLNICMWLAMIALFVAGAYYLDREENGLGIALIVSASLMCTAALVVAFGFFTVQPNAARVLVLFGEYKGTVRAEGFRWANPFSVPRAGLEARAEGGHAKVTGGANKYDVSLRARNFETGKIKVNDLRGNPIEIGAVVVWRVVDTAQAMFDVDDYQSYVRIQAESALRQLANKYPYDHADKPEDEVTLRANAEVVAGSLKQELHERLNKAGVDVVEARLSHLAYAPEIATVMLRRQQAEAVIAARQKIVHGAVSMVEMALRELSEKHVVELDEERKAAMVGNLLVVLCGEAEAQPILNTGTLYP